MDDAIYSLDVLPPGPELMRRWQALAALEAIIMPEWEYRYFSFNTQWCQGESMGSMRDGCGGEVFFLFNAAGVAGKIYEKEAGMIGGEGLGAIPSEFKSFANEPAFSLDRASCFLWQLRGGNWEMAPLGASKIPLLAYVCDHGEFYQKWAADYYEMEMEIDMDCVRKVWDMEPLTNDLIKAVNPERDISELREELKEIGYP